MSEQNKASPAALTDEQTRAQLESLARHPYGGRFPVYMSGDDARALLAAQPAAPARVKGAWCSKCSAFQCECIEPAPVDRQGVALSDAWSDLLAYVLQDDLHNRLTPRVVDIAYTAFMLALERNKDDGGPTDWFNDIRPAILKLIEKLRKDLTESRASSSQAEVERDAARYRRIRNGPHSDRHGDVYAMVFMPDGDTPIHGAKLDSIIDAARAAAETPNGEKRDA